MREIGAASASSPSPVPTLGPLEHPPRRDTRFAAGDQAYLVGPYEELLRVLSREREGAGA